MPEIPYGGLKGDDATDEHLWKRRLMIGDADDVWDGPAKYFDQGPQLYMDETGRPRERPARVVMIGPDGSGRLLTIILDLPDSQSESRVVTGWISDSGEKSRYDQPGGRKRRQ